MELSGQQKSRLRGIGQKLEPIARVGKQGLHPTLLDNVRTCLEKRGLVKVRFDDHKEHRKSLSQELAEKTGSILVGQVGFTSLFYLPVPGGPTP